MDLGLADKVVIVTGGGSNIGRGIVLAFAREGSSIVNAEIDEEQGMKVVDEANGLGGRATLVKTDVTDRDSVRAMVEEVLGRFGKIDVLVNNVGGAERRPFVEKGMEECETEVRLNFWSVVNCVKAVVDHMIQRKYGKIINIGSDASHGGVGGGSVSIYAGAKGGVVSLSRSLAWELGRYGINVNVVCPGFTPPKSQETIGEGSSWAKWDFGLYASEVQRVMPYRAIRRECIPEDIGNMVVFLASDRASFVTGHVMDVNGGFNMR